MEKYSIFTRMGRRMRQSEREQKKLYKKIKNEYDQITIKLNKLDVFIGTKKYYRLTSTHQDLLKKQYLAMKDYRNILEKRMKLIGKSNGEA